MATSAINTQTRTITPMVALKTATKATAVTLGGLVAYDAITKEQMEWSWKTN